MACYTTYVCPRTSLLQRLITLSRFRTYHDRNQTNCLAFLSNKPPHSQRSEGYKCRSSEPLKNIILIKTL